MAHFNQLLRLFDALSLHPTRQIARRGVPTDLLPPMRNYPVSFLTWQQGIQPALEN